MKDISFSGSFNNGEVVIPYHHKIESKSYNAVLGRNTVTGELAIIDSRSNTILVKGSPDNLGDLLPYSLPITSHSFDVKRTLRPELDYKGRPQWYAISGTLNEETAWSISIGLSDLITSAISGLEPYKVEEGSAWYRGVIKCYLYETHKGHFLGEY